MSNHVHRDCGQGRSVRLASLAKSLAPEGCAAKGMAPSMTSGMMAMMTWPLLGWLDWLNAWTKFWLRLKFRHGNFTYSDFPLTRITKL